MLIKMTKTLFLNQYKYKFSNMYEGYANVTFNILYKELSLISCRSNFILYAKQYNVWKKLLTIIPFLNVKIAMFEVDKCPFKIFNNEHKEIGYINYVYGYKFEIFLQNDIYYVQLHNGNKASICKNNMKVALIEKDWLYSFFKSEYTIMFNGNISVDILNFIVLFADSSIFGFRCAPFALGTKLVIYDDAKELGKWS